MNSMPTSQVKSKSTSSIVSNATSSIVSKSTSFIVAIFFVFIVVHGLLIGFGLVHQDSLLSGDRADSRNATIAYVFDIDKIGGNNTSLETSPTLDPMLNIGDRILKSGHAGDYFLSGAIIKLSSTNILVLLQLLLALLSTLSVFALLIYLVFLLVPQH